MALDAILGSDTQNSYVTMEEATTYFEDRAYSSDWNTFEDKGPLLILCSRLLDWYINWKGFKTSITQPMQWPRTDVILRDGTELDDDVLPQEVKTAVFELALSSLEEDRTEEDPLLGLEQLKVATLSLKAKPDQSGRRTSSTQVIPSKVKRILTDLRNDASFGVVRLMRG